MDAGFGFSVVEDFITPDEELAILAEIPRPPFKKGTTERNSISRFGRRHVYSNCFVSSVIPPMLETVARRLHEQQHLDAVPTCVTVNQYYPGQVIPPHHDDRSCGPVITVLSLLSPATMRFSRRGLPSKTYVLQPRSLSFMRGESRYDWMHAVDPVEAERYSIVFRA